MILDLLSNAINYENTRHNKNPTTQKNETKFSQLQESLNLFHELNFIFVRALKNHSKVMRLLKKTEADATIKLLKMLMNGLARFHRPPINMRARNFFTSHETVFYTFIHLCIRYTLQSANRNFFTLVTLQHSSTFLHDDDDHIAFRTLGIKYKTTLLNYERLFYANVCIFHSSLEVD